MPLLSPGSDSDHTWPHSASSYTLLRQIGRGAFASVYSAVVNLPDGTAPPEVSGGFADKMVGYVYPYCAIKIIELENVNSSIDDIRQEVLILRTVKHPNTLDGYASFVHNQQLWLVTQIMACGSCLHALQCLPQAGLPGGFPETAVAYVLYETLKGLSYFHSCGHIHRDLKSGNILIGSLGGVRLADFGVSGWLQNVADRRLNTKTFVGTPCWMAPEVMEQIDGYDYRADIWSLGITALEIAMGYAPYAHFPPMKVLLLTIQEDPPNLMTYEMCGGVTNNGESERREREREREREKERAHKR
jgi:serine/threonine-protein kinase OSR1/STK39